MPSKAKVKVTKVRTTTTAKVGKSETSLVEIQTNVRFVASL